MMNLKRVSGKERVQAGKATATVHKQHALVVFHLGEQAYGIPLHEVQEIVPLAALSRPPGLPSVLAGFLNLAGTAVPVLRLDRLFELPALTPGRYTPLLLLRNPDYRLALMVDKVSRIVSVAAEAVMPVREKQSFNDCVEGVVTLDDHVILLLSAERILLEKEHQLLAEFQDREQARLRVMEETSP